MNEGQVSLRGNIDLGKDSILDVSVSITPEMLLYTGLAAMALIIIAVLSAGLLILRRKPIKILSEMS